MMETTIGYHGPVKMIYLAVIADGNDIRTVVADGNRKIIYVNDKFCIRRLLATFIFFITDK